MVSAISDNSRPVIGTSFAYCCIMSCDSKTACSMLTIPASSASLMLSKRVILIRCQVETNNPRPRGQVSQCLVVGAQSRQAALQLPDYGSEVTENSVGKFLFSKLIPHMLLRIEFGSIRRQCNKPDVFRPLEVLCLMRACAPSSTMTTKSSGWAALTCDKKSVICSVFIFRLIIQSISPSIGLTAP